MAVVGSTNRQYVVAEPGAPVTLLNVAGDSLFYGGSDVSASSYEGVLAAGGSVALSQGKWVSSAGTSRYETRGVQASSVSASSGLNASDSGVAMSSVQRQPSAPWVPGALPFGEPDSLLVPATISTERDVIELGGRLHYAWDTYLSKTAAQKAQLVDGPFGGKAFTGGSEQGSYAVFPVDGTLDLNEFTVEVWIKSNAADFAAQTFTTAYTLLAFDGTGAQSEGLRLVRSAAGTLAWEVRNNASAVATASLTIVTGDIPADTWTCVSATFDGTTLTAYLGNNAKNASGARGNAIPSYALSSSEFQLGGLLINPGTGGTTINVAATPGSAFSVSLPHVRRYVRTPAAITFTKVPGVTVDATIPGTSYPKETSGVLAQYYGWKDATVDGAGGLGTSVRDKAILASAAAPLVRIDHPFDGRVTITGSGPFTYDWSALDESMDRWMAANPNVQFGITLGYCPTPLRGAGGISAVPSSNSLFAQVCSDAVAHWLAKGYKLFYLSFWNEPSLGNFWAGDTTQFTTLWTAVATRLQTDYGSNALVPKLGTPDDIGTIGKQNAVVTAAQGAGLPLGSYHIHDYSGQARNYRTNLAAARSTLNTAGFTSTPVMVTEWNDNQNVLAQVYDTSQSASKLRPDRVRRARHAALTFATAAELVNGGARAATFTRLGIIDDAYANIERALGLFTQDDPPRPLPAYAVFTALWKLGGQRIPCYSTHPGVRGLATWDSTGRKLVAVIGSYVPIMAEKPLPVSLGWQNLPSSFSWTQWRFLPDDVADGRLRKVATGDQTNLPAGVNLSGGGISVIQVTSSSALASFSTETLSGLALNFDADSITGVDGDPVSSWADSGVGGQSLTGSGTARPTLKKNIVNGHAVARFVAGSSQVLTAAYSSDPLGTGAYTLLAVVSNANSDGQMVQMRKNGDSNPIKAGLRGANIRTQQRNDATTLVSPGSPVTNNGVWEVCALRYDGAKIELRANGANAGKAAASGAITTNRLFLGADNGSGTFASFDVSKLVAWPRALSDDEFRHAELDLATRYGITIAG